MALAFRMKLIDRKERQGCVCCMCKEPYAKYLVTTKDGTKMYCNRCIIHIERYGE